MAAETITPSAALGLKHDTLHFLGQVHQAWSTQASPSAYAEIRDELLIQQDNLDTRVAVLSTVARIAYPDEFDIDEKWQELFAMAKSNEEDEKQHKRSYHETNRFRNCAIVAALWSSRVIFHYGWDKVGQTQMYLIRACAVQYPRFSEDLCPRLNSVLLQRHRQGIRDGRTKTLNEVSIQPSRDLAVTNLPSVISNLDEEIPWLNDESGNFPLETGGPWLSQLRPSHFQSYLLKKDCFGVLVARDDRFLQQSHSGTSRALPGSAAPQNSPSPSCEPVDESRSTMATQGGLNLTTEGQCTLPLDSQNPLVLSSQVFNTALRTCFDPCIAASPSTVLTPGEHIPWTGEPTGLQQNRHSSSVISASPQIFDSDPEIAFWTSLRDGSPTGFGVTVSDVVQDHATISPSPEGGVTRESTTDSEFNSESQLESSIEVQNQPEQVTTNSASGKFIASAKTHSQHGKIWKSARPTRRSKAAMPKPASLDLGKERGAQHSGRWAFSVASPRIYSQDSRTIEEILHERHYGMLVGYMLRFGSKTRCGSSQQQNGCIQWLNPDTKWASIWTHSQDGSPRGGALSADEAEVHYYTSDDFLAIARKGQILRKPIVIKEKFSDSGMHDVDSLACLLKDALGGDTIEVRTLDEPQPVPIPVDEFIDGMRTSRLEGANAIHMRNITKSHRPLFTMLPRFRLLEGLVGRVRGSFLGKKIVSAPVEVTSRVGFNVLGLGGAISRARLGSLCGTWARNLSGVQLWLIVPDEEMELEWETFAQAGSHWAPNGKQRILLLEQDDVLIMPPGLRVIHAVHSPTNSLMEGGMFWDELNIIQILQSVHWICKNQATADEDIACQLPSIIGDLEKLVKEQPDRFRSDMSRIDFLCAFERATLALKNIGCHCPLQDCNEWCDCRREGRRCTAWCVDHSHVGQVGCVRGLSTDQDEIRVEIDHVGVW